MTLGRLPPAGFNSNLGIFLAKGSKDDDSEQFVKRCGEETRPLGVKNTDNKVIAGTVNGTIAPLIDGWADDQQNGFISGRQGQRGHCRC